MDNKNFKSPLSKDVLDAAKKGNTEALKNMLSNEDKKALSDLLSNKAAMEKALNSREAKMLMNLLSKGGKNG